MCYRKYDLHVCTTKSSLSGLHAYLVPSQAKPVQYKLGQHKTVLGHNILCSCLSCFQYDSSLYNVQGHVFQSGSSQPLYMKAHAVSQHFQFSGVC